MNWLILLFVCYLSSTPEVECDSSADDMAFVKKIKELIKNSRLSQFNLNKEKLSLKRRDLQRDEQFEEIEYQQPRHIADPFELAEAEGPTPDDRRPNLNFRRSRHQKHKHSRKAGNDLASAPRKRKKKSKHHHPRDKDCDDTNNENEECVELESHVGPNTQKIETESREVTKVIRPVESQTDQPVTHQKSESDRHNPENQLENQAQPDFKQLEEQQPEELKELQQDLKELQKQDESQYQPDIQQAAPINQQQDQIALQKEIQQELQKQKIQPAGLELPEVKTPKIEKLLTEATPTLALQTSEPLVKIQPLRMGDEELSDAPLDKIKKKKIQKRLRSNEDLETKEIIPTNRPAYKSTGIDIGDGVDDENNSLPDIPPYPPKYPKHYNSSNYVYGNPEKYGIRNRYKEAVVYTNFRRKGGRDLYDDEHDDDRDNDYNDDYDNLYDRHSRRDDEYDFHLRDDDYFDNLRYTLKNHRPRSYKSLLESLLESVREYNKSKQKRNGRGKVVVVYGNPLKNQFPSEQSSVAKFIDDYGDVDDNFSF